MKFVETMYKFFGFSREEAPYRSQVPTGSGPTLEETLRENVQFFEAGDEFATESFFEEDGMHLHEPFDPEVAGFETGWARLPLLQQVRDLMSDGEWYTLAELSWATDASEASCSARVRDLRKVKYGENTVERRYAGKGIYQYRLTERPF